MPLFKRQTAKPKWIREKERESRKRRWWEIKAPKDGIARGSQYETSLERDNATYGAVGSIIFSAVIFLLISGLVILLNWIGQNLI